MIQFFLCKSIVKRQEQSTEHIQAKCFGSNGYRHPQTDLLWRQKTTQIIIVIFV